MNGLAHQRGMGYWGYMLVIVAVVVFGKLGMTSIPPYISNQTLDTVIMNKLKVAGNKTADQVIADIDKQLHLDLPNMKTEEIIEVVSDVQGNVVLKTNYDERHNLFAHVDVVSHFEKEYHQTQQ